MKSNTIETYTCEICGSSYEDKNAATLCESSGIPKNKNKFIGKFLLAPIQVLIDSNTETHSSIEWKIKWSIIRIDSEIIKPSAPALVRNNLLTIHKFDHRMVYQGLKFYKNSYIFDSLLHKAIEIPEDISEPLLKQYLDIHSKRNSMSESLFDEYLYKNVENIISETIQKLNLNIKNSDFDNYSLEGLNDVSNNFING